ncbi:hypothetical protein BKA67DRAFT_539332 [Truncatella angustata]|uniref:Uncharacterized protein n=1 Tax=Truncatella angustata TaxID=152316 RepID=A0A9P8RK03_9PEZI|nr:uncharacterized protein BKA67DRAFT_539332 [Truncatella angustata]KAH6647471.1 hypothetical protein BKA67DRAFT_539332 [Truncatella angustata]KAH8205404.1 hypothetical protein TruAng_000483 [Truncatella angustata]
MSNGDDGRSATDIITYIGVPLAVLGVLPILYNTVATLAALSRIKRMLRRARLTALTRSDIVNKVIEVDLPRYAVTPWDRFSQRNEYWQISRQPSQIPGGSWTTFNWKTNTIGIKTQRIEYADQLRQPQVEVAFDELVSYLLDLGAVPDAHSWKVLRSSGMWTPAGCTLMVSPMGHKALTIAPLDDSDGHLSLAVNWSSSWTTRDSASLPPFWVRLPPPTTLDADGQAEASISETPGDTSGEAEQEVKGQEEIPKQSLDSVQKQAQTNSAEVIDCQVSVDGLVTALSQDLDTSRSDSGLQNLYIEHLRLRTGNLVGVWFASAITAYGTTNQTVLWNYKIPDELLTFAGKHTVPCGVLSLLGIVDESNTPQWATRFDGNSDAHELFVRRQQEQRLAIAAENKMSPEQRQTAIGNRMQTEMYQRMQDMRDKLRLDRQRLEQHELEALQSPKWDAKLVAEHNLKWLKNKQLVAESTTLKDAVGMVLHRMILDGHFTSSICNMLDLWKGWADNAGMRKSDLYALKDDQVTFAQASLLVAMIKDTTTAHEGSLAVDLQDCVKMWRTVRLG